MVRRRTPFINSKRYLVAFFNKSWSQVTGAIVIEYSVSLDYFSDSTVISDGCYFVLNGEWIQNMRLWLQGNQQFEQVKLLRYGVCCKDDRVIIPGYMNHFIMGVSSIPCEVGFGRK